MRLAIALLALVALIGVFAPVLVGERPLWVSTPSGSHCPVWTGEDLGPDGRPWMDLVESRAEGDQDVAVWMPLHAVDPRAVFPSEAGAGPSDVHPLGVDRSGRDQLSRLVHATRTALLVGLVATGLALAIGAVLGAVSAFGPGFVRASIDRLVAAWLGFPLLVAVLGFSSAFGGSVLTTAVLIGAFTWTGFARVIRDGGTALRSSERILTAREFGVGPIGLALRHSGPELWGPVRVLAAFVCAEAILVEAALSFLGVGVGMTSVSWGSMLRDGRLAAVSGGSWHDWLPPAVMLVLASVCLHRCADRRTLNAAGGGL